MIGTSPSESLLSLLNLPLLSFALFLIYKCTYEFICGAFDIFKNLKEAYDNLPKMQYFTMKTSTVTNRFKTVVLHIYSCLFFASLGIVLSVYYYIFTDGQISLLGPVLILVISLFLDRRLGKYRIFYRLMLLSVKLLIYIPLLLIKLYSLAIDKICKNISKI